MVVKGPPCVVPKDFWRSSLAGLFASGCVGGSKGLAAEDKDKLKSYILDAPPADMQHKIDVNFENKVHLIGYKFDPETAKPGQEVKLTYWWRCDDTLDDGWLLFTHTKDEGSGKMGNLDFSGPLRDQRNGTHQVLGPERWEKGKVYVDEQTYKVPDDVSGSEITVYAGIWKGDARLRIISGPNDGDNSAIVGKIKTGSRRRAEEHTSNDVPSMTASKLAKSGVIKVDGKGDEPEWGARRARALSSTWGRVSRTPQFPVNGSAKVLWDDDNLYVLVKVQEADFYTGFTDAKAQPSDFTADGPAEALDEGHRRDDGRARRGGEQHELLRASNQPAEQGLQVAVRHAAAAERRAEWALRPRGLGPEAQERRVRSRRDAAARTSGYTVEAAIPWTAYAKAANHPPKPGDVWRINFYAMKQNAGVAWSPILGQGELPQGVAIREGHVGRDGGRRSGGVGGRSRERARRCRVDGRHGGTSPDDATSAGPRTPSAAVGVSRGLGASLR